MITHTTGVVDEEFRLDAQLIVLPNLLFPNQPNCSFPVSQDREEKCRLVLSYVLKVRFHDCFPFLITKRKCTHCRL